MLRFAPLVLILVAAALFALSFFGADSYSQLAELQQGHQVQQAENADLDSYVTSLQNEVHGLRHDKRALERAARNELGVAADNELIFVFEPEKVD